MGVVASSARDKAGERKARWMANRLRVRCVGGEGERETRDAEDDVNNRQQLLAQSKYQEGPGVRGVCNLAEVARQEVEVEAE